MIKKEKISFFLLSACIACNSGNEITKKPVQLVTLDPGHFHAALVQKSMYPDVDSTVYVYAPAGNDLKYHLDRINGYNARAEDPTHWDEKIYSGEDFFEKMIAEKKGNVVVLSGNNKKKSEYIVSSLQNGFNVFADKPMVINSKGFEKLKEAFAVAKKNDLLLYDIMTERYEITTQLQKELSMIPEIFGTLEKGSIDNPAITKESVHHLYKYVSGNVLTRPAWFLDASQQGEGIVDVMTHLVDLVQWEAFPEKIIDTNNIKINSAKRWTTDIGLSAFQAITKLEKFPLYLDNNISNDTILHIFCNGEINYTINNVYAKTSVTWRYKAPEGTGDTHYSIMRGTKANLVIRQGQEENYKPVLYIDPVSADPGYKLMLTTAFTKLRDKYPGLELTSVGKMMKVIIPEKYIEGHEAHFARVTEKFLGYLKNKNIPAWEVPNMIAKYYTTTKALELALKNE
ncbi:MAG: oxidoreductase [Chitinophagales bacterium]|nr:oxidoreductase [Chitinophagales bacterium]